MATAFFTASVEKGARVHGPWDMRAPPALASGPTGPMTLVIDPTHVRTKGQLSALLDQLRELLLDSLAVNQKIGGFPIALSAFPAAVQSELAAQHEVAKAARG